MANPQIRTLIAERNEQEDIAELEASLEEASARLSAAFESQQWGLACSALQDIADDLESIRDMDAIIDLSGIVLHHAAEFQRADPEHWAWFLNLVGIAHSHRSELPQSQSAFEDMLRLGRQLKDNSIISTALQNLGVTWHKIGDQTRAKRYYSRSLRLKTTIGDHSGLAEVQNNLAEIAIEEGSYREAEGLLSASLEAKKRMRDAYGLIAAYGTFGNLAVAEVNYAEAQEYFSMALKQARKCGDAEDVASASLSLGNVLMELGKDKQAFRRYQEGLEIAKLTGEMQAEEMLERALAVGFTKVGNEEEARKHFLRLANLDRRLGKRFDEAMAYRDAAVVSTSSGDHEMAVNLYRKAAVRFGSAQDPGWQAQTLVEMASALASLGAESKAKSAIRKAICLLEPHKLYDQLAEVYRNGVQVFLQLGRMDWAKSLFAKEREFLVSRQEQETLARRLSEMGAVYIDRNMPGRAIVLLSEAVSVYKQLGSASLEALTRMDLAIALAHNGKVDEARKMHEGLVEDARSMRDRALESQALSNLSELLRWQGELDGAVHMATRALDLARRMHDALGMAISLNNLGLAYQDKGNVEQAQACFEQSLASALESGEESTQARVLRSLGNLAMESDRYKIALRHYDRAVEVLQASDPALLPLLLSDRLACLLALGEEDKASTAAPQAIDAAEKVSDYLTAGTVAGQVAVANLDQGDVRNAAEALFATVTYAIARSRRAGYQALVRLAALVGMPDSIPYDRTALHEAFLKRVERLSPQSATTLGEVLNVASKAVADRISSCRDSEEKQVFTKWPILREMIRSPIE